MRKRHGGAFLTLTGCVLAVPTVAVIMGFLPKTRNWETYLPCAAVGAVLGIVHILLRPLLRLITLPLGCITLGLSGMVIDIALIYFSASFVRGFEVPSLLYALLTALAVNVVKRVAG